MGKLTESNSEVQDQEAAHKRALEVKKLAVILSEDIGMFKDGESTVRSFSKDQIKLI